MPTATSLSGFGLVNVGPLTTTFSAPASCSAAGYRTVIAPATVPGDLLYGADCLWNPAPECNPQPDALRSLISSANSGNPTAGQFIAYNSPGLVCPAGFATVGSAERASPTSITFSGGFNSPVFPNGTSDENDRFFEPGLEIFLAAMDPGETAVMCCPR
jgi:hypothetical protein